MFCYNLAVKEKDIWQEAFEPKKRSKKWLLLSILALVIVVSLVVVLADFPDYNIEGDKVFINDSNAYISAEPHTIYKPTWVEVNLQVKKNVPEIDFGMGVDYPPMKPTEALYFIDRYYNVTKSYVCGALYIANFTDECAWCWYNQTHTNNATGTSWGEYELIKEICGYDSIHIPSRTIYWQEIEYEEWRDVSGAFENVNYDYQGMTKWYFFKNFAVTQNQMYKLKVKIDMPINLENHNGKYWIVAKPSNEGIHEAIQNGHFYALDPWYNSNYGKRQPACFNHTRSAQLNTVVTLINGTNGIDTASMVSAGKLQADCDDLTFADVSGNELPWDFDTTHTDANYGCNTANTIIWIRIDNITNTECVYMYYNNTGASSLSNNSVATFQDMVLAITFGQTVGGIRDKTVFNNSGGIWGSPIRQTSGCKMGNCFNVTSTSDYVLIADDNSLDFPTTFTMMAWIVEDDDTAGYNGHLIHKAEGTTDNGWWWISDENSRDELWFSWGWPPGDHNFGILMNFSQWTVLAVQQDGTNLRGFIDGRTDNETADQKDLTNAFGLKIGGDEGVLSLQQNQAIYDTIFMWNASLPDDEIKYYAFDLENSSFGAEESYAPPNSDPEATANWTIPSIPEYNYTAWVYANVTEPENDTINYCNFTLWNSTGYVFSNVKGTNTASYSGNVTEWRSSSFLANYTSEVWNCSITCGDNNSNVDTISINFTTNDTEILVDVIELNGGAVSGGAGGIFGIQEGQLGANVNFTINMTEYSNCSYLYYNVTRGASVEVSNTAITCTNNTYNYTGNFTLSSYADYIMRVWANDTYNNPNYTTTSFTWSPPSSGDSSSSGGGGSAPTIVFGDLELSPSIIDKWFIWFGTPRLETFNVNADLPLESCEIMGEPTITCEVTGNDGHSVIVKVNLNDTENFMFKNKDYVIKVTSRGGKQKEVNALARIYNLGFSIPFIPFEWDDAPNFVFQVQDGEVIGIRAYVIAVIILLLLSLDWFDKKRK